MVGCNKLASVGPRIAAAAAAGAVAVAGEIAVAVAGEIAVVAEASSFFFLAVERGLRR